MLASYTARRNDRRHQRPQNSFRILPIKVIFHLKIRRLATLKFKDALTENKKKDIYVAVEKQQRKRKTERKWKANEQTGSSLRELKTGRLVLTDKFQIVIHI